MSATDLEVRRAQAGDAPVVATIHLRARAASPMPDSVHPEHEVHEWVAGRIAVDEVWVAVRAGQPVAYARLTPGWLDDLYVLPEEARQGVGSALLGLAQARQPDGFCLWVFESNRPARDFYAGHGLIELEGTDGSANEERAPDLRMAWPGADPLGFLRRLIDDVDEQLGDLLARRVALTRAVQVHKADTTRDPARERSVVARLAARAPELGADRIARIVDAVITESLEAVRDTSS